MLELSNEILFENSTEPIECVDERLIDYFNTFLETYLILKEEE